MSKYLRQGSYPIVYLGVSVPTNSKLQEHSVVVIEIDRKAVHVLDPERGELTTPKQIFEEQWAYLRRLTIWVQ